MHNFVNDYNCLAHPEILKRMEALALEKQPGYGLDRHCARAKELLYKELGTDKVDIHFIPGGTGTNLIAIAAFLRPHHAVLGATTAHINEHEAGSIEACGHKVVTVPTVDGKLRPDDLAPVLESHNHDNQVKIRMVYISDSTEVGTVYNKKEMKDLHDFCRAKDLLLFVDGARMGSALTSDHSDLIMKDFVKYTDAFYIGGTKNGALLGEALVIVNEGLKEDFRYIMKQKGGILAKSFIMGIQFETLFEDGLYYRLAEKANYLANKLAAGLKDLGVNFIQEPQSNQIFPIFNRKQIEKLRKDFAFEDWAYEGDGLYSVRFVTTWSSSEEGVDALINACSQIMMGA